MSKLKTLKISNFRSIIDLSLEFDNCNIFVGESGSGKTNVLESLALLSTIYRKHNITNLELYDVGLRNKGFGETLFSDFINYENDNYIRFQLSVFEKPSRKFNYILENNKSEYIKWNLIKNSDEIYLPLWNELKDFKIFSPEYTVLKTEYDSEVPLKCKGEGLFKLLSIIKFENPNQWDTIQKYMKIFDWFDFLDVDKNGSEIYVKNKFLSKKIPIGDICQSFI